MFFFCILCEDPEMKLLSSTGALNSSLLMDKNNSTCIDTPWKTHGLSLSASMQAIWHHSNQSQLVLHLTVQTVNSCSQVNVVVTRIRTQPCDVVRRCSNQGAINETNNICAVKCPCTGTVCDFEIMISKQNNNQSWRLCEIIASFPIPHFVVT